MCALTRRSSSTLNVRQLEAAVLGVGRREVRRRARWQRDHAGVDDAHVANVNAERLRDPLALDAVGAGEHAQEHLPRQVGERGREAIVEAALLGHDAGQVEELPPRGRDAAVFVADRAPHHREQHVPDVEHPIAFHRAEAAGFAQHRIAIEQAREHGRERGNYELGRGLRVDWRGHRQPHAATRWAPLQPPEITPLLSDCRCVRDKLDA